MSIIDPPEHDLTPIPPSRRQRPGRVKAIPARLYVDRFREHREAYHFLQKMQKMYGGGTKSLVRALLHWRDTVALPLEEHLASGKKGRLPKSLQVARAEMTEITARGARVKQVSVRLYIDKWVEHREAYEFLQRQQRLHGEGNKTIVRAILYYRDALEKQGKKKK